MFGPALQLALSGDVCVGGHGEEDSFEICDIRGGGVWAAGDGGADFVTCVTGGGARRGGEEDRMAEDIMSDSSEAEWLDLKLQKEKMRYDQRSYEKEKRMMREKDKART